MKNTFLKSILMCSFGGRGVAFAILLFLFHLGAMSQYTAIPDKKFEQFLIDEGYDDKIDGEVLTSKINNVKKLFIDNKGIKSLTGIEEFTALVSLYCYKNNLTSLNLNNNLNLENLHCGENGLTSIDLKKNTKLNIFFCYNTQFTSLDFSKNIHLEYVSCFGNPYLTNVNLKNGKGEQFLLVDLRDNPNLICIIVDDPQSMKFRFFPYDKAIHVKSQKECDDIFFTYIPDPNFEKALIDKGLDSGPIDGKIFTSNISHIKELRVKARKILDLTGIEDFVNLETLDCYDNELTELEVGSNTNLEYLYCGKNKITGLNVDKNVKMKHLNFYDNLLTLLSIRENIVLESLNLGKNKMTCLDMRNGNNQNISFLYAKENPDLKFVIVDDVSNNNWVYKFNSRVKFLDIEEGCSLDIRFMRSLTDRVIINVLSSSMEKVSVKISDQYTGEVIKEIKIVDNVGKLLRLFKGQKQYDFKGLDDVIYIKVKTNKRVIRGTVYLRSIFEYK